MIKVMPAIFKTDKIDTLPIGEKNTSYQTYLKKESENQKHY